MRKRKLITETTLLLICAELEIGVPLARAMHNHDIKMSRPTVAKLVQHLMVPTARSLIPALKASLFPDWLVVDEQEQPDGVYYEGAFPFGEWTHG